MNVCSVGRAACCLGAWHRLSGLSVCCVGLGIVWFWQFCHSKCRPPLYCCCCDCCWCCRQDPAMAEEEVVLIVEAQLILDHYMEMRQHTHLYYKVVREGQSKASPRVLISSRSGWSIVLLPILPSFRRGGGDDGCCISFFTLLNANAECQMHRCRIHKCTNAEWQMKQMPNAQMPNAQALQATTMPSKTLNLPDFCCLAGTWAELALDCLPDNVESIAGAQAEAMGGE